MRIACSTLLYDDEALGDACGLIADHGFEAVDLAARPGWAHLDPGDLPGRVEETAARVDSACEAAGVDPVSLNAAVDEEAAAPGEEQVRALAALADALGIDAFTLGCGGDADRPLAEAIERSRRLAGAVRECDATLTHETHTGCLTEDPTVAHGLVAGAPELGLTLDPSHFWFDATVDRPQDCYDELLPHVAHVHVRGVAGEAWVPIDDPDSRVDYGRLVERLRTVDYGGALSVEYIGAESPDSETARMAAGAREYLRDLL